MTTVVRIGDPEAEVGEALLTLDCTEEVVAEAVRNKCGLIIAHHPVIFKGLKTLTGRNEVERTLLAAIRANVAIYAIHTNLDNVIDGVNGEIAARIGLEPLHVLDPKPGLLPNFPFSCRTPMPTRCEMHCSARVPKRWGL